MFQSFFRESRRKTPVMVSIKDGEVQFGDAALAVVRIFLEFILCLKVQHSLVTEKTLFKSNFKMAHLVLLILTY